MTEPHYSRAGTFGAKSFSSSGSSSQELHKDMGQDTTVSEIHSGLLRLCSANLGALSHIPQVVFVMKQQVSKK